MTGKEVPRPVQILVVEDEWLLASELARKLTQEGFAVVGPVATVAEALQLIDAVLPDAAILDVQLDGETTFSISDRLDREGIPLMFLSGHPTTDFKAHLSGRIVLLKPADWPHVMKTVEKLLENPR